MRISNSRCTATYILSILSVLTSPPLVDVYQHTAIGVQQLGLGKVAYLGFRYYNYNDDTYKVLENAVRWCARPEWISTEPASLSLALGESAIVQVKFTSRTLVENTYVSTLNWATNHPLSPQISVTCSLHVEGEPLLESSLTNLNFGIIQQFGQKTLDVPIHNAGCDTLNLSAPVVDNPIFSVASYPAIVLPNQDEVVKVIFNPQLPGGQNAVLTIQTDGGSATVQLTGNAVGAPVASVSPVSLEVNLTCDESITVPITLNNSGLGAFNYQIGGLNSPRQILGLTYGASIYRWNNFRTYLVQNVPNTTLTTYEGAAANALADLLTQTDGQRWKYPTTRFMRRLNRLFRTFWTMADKCSYWEVTMFSHWSRWGCLIIFIRSNTIRQPYRLWTPIIRLRWTSRPIFRSMTIAISAFFRPIVM
jgi:hypothetical protein